MLSIAKNNPKAPEGSFPSGEKIQSYSFGGGQRADRQNADHHSSTYVYTYDSNGNIASVKTASKTTTYVYDTANQLLRENNEAAGKTWTYSYDSAGNILTKKEYAYTTGTLGTVLDSISYSYGDSDWGDLLTSYDGHAITYDGVGNPLTDGTWTYTWEHGRQLASMSKAGTTWTYTYDADGMRTSRSNGSTTYRYVYNGGKLRQMTVGDDTLQFMYDANGVPMSMLHNGTLYYYVTNIQGDVAAILNTTGTAVVAYSYDAWGNATATTDSMAATLGVLNPLRYRGYIFDTETGLYYLQSRYFNPKMARFINADAIISVDDLLGHNQFAYCDNNPVNKVDYTGEDGETVDLGKGWHYRIDPANEGTRTKRHIHIWKNGKSYAQNEDGSPHDQDKNNQGPLDKKVQEAVLKSAGWDYNGKREDFYNKTEIMYDPEAVYYTFADGTHKKVQVSFFRPLYPSSVDQLESLYCKPSQEAGAGTDRMTSIRTFFLPIFGPIVIPTFSFGWGLFPIPALF